MKQTYKLVLIVFTALLSTSAYSQLELLIGRSQPVGGFAKKSGFEQAGYGKQGTCFQLNALGEDGKLKMTMSVFAGLNKFNIDSYGPQFLEANKTNGKNYTRFEVGKYFNFGLAFGPEYRLKIGEKIIIPFRAHVGVQIMMPPLKFKAYYTEANPFTNAQEESYDEMSGSFVYEVIGLNFRLGTGVIYKFGSSTGLIARVDYNNRFLAGQMTYGSGNARATYPKKFTNVDLSIGLAFGLD